MPANTESIEWWLKLQDKIAINNRYYFYCSFLLLRGTRHYRGWRAAGHERRLRLMRRRASLYWLLGNPGQEIVMTRKYIDCREFPSETNCSVTIAADREEELIDAAAQHAVAVHKHADTPELRQQLKGIMREGRPPD
jgi:predicted small metal-binding protein